MGFEGRVWELKDLRYSTWTTVAAGTILIKTDLPSGGMLTRKTVVVATSTERITDAIPLDGIEAKQLQVKFIPHATGFMRVYQAKVLARPIGVFLSGANSDYYETQPISLGAS